jgi:3-oxoadipate enol-lactonase
MRDHAQDLAGLIEALGVENVILCGISVGAMIAMDFTTQHPDSVKALVVGDGMPKIGTADMWNQRIDTLRQHGMAHLADMILARWFAPSFKDTHPIDYRGYSNMLTRMPVTGYTGTCEAIRDSDLTEAVRGITCPTLVLCGAEDASTPPDMVRGLTEIVPNSRFVEIAKAGHLPCVENPSATSDAIDTFLKDVL